MTSTAPTCWRSSICSDQRPALLFIGCFRAEDAEQNPFLLEMRGAMAKEPEALDHRELAVEELSLAEARQLALALLGRDDAVALAQAHMVATESRGNPLFIDELVRHIQSGEPIERWEAIGQLDLDEVLWTRIQRQPEDALRLLGLVAVSGRPISQSLAFQASELGAACASPWRRCDRPASFAALGRHIMRKSRSITTGFARRLWRTCRANPFAGTTSGWRLCSSTTGSVDPEILAVHYRGAGQTGRACEYYSVAADQAAAALAFDRSARLFRVALELHQGTPAQAGVLWRKLGDALANAGRGNEAAQVYAKAAETATAAETLELKRLASTQLLLSGEVENGLALLRTLLRPLGLSMPQTARRAWLLALLASIPAGAAGAQVPEARREPDLGDDAGADRSLLVGRGGALDVGADPRGRLPDARAAAGAESRRAAADCTGPGDGSRAPRHRGCTRGSAGREPARRSRADRTRDRLALRSRNDRNGARLRRAHARRVAQRRAAGSKKPRESSASTARA